MSINALTHWSRLALSLGLSALLALPAPLVAQAQRVQSSSTALPGNTVGSFEIDGNLIVNHSVPPAEPIDWDSSPFPAALTTFTDGTKSADDIFGMGSKENDQSTWICIAGSAPPKDDVVDEISINGAPPIAGEIAFRFFPVSGVEKQFLYANWSRLSNNGDAHIDYEFNQADPSTSPVPSCPQLPQRMPGDFLISFDTQNGGATIGVSAFTWNGTTFVPLSEPRQESTCSVNSPSMSATPLEQSPATKSFSCP